MYQLFFRYYWGLVSRYFRNRRLAKIITLSLFLWLVGLVSSGVYLFLVSGFQFINRDSYLAEAFSLLIFELFGLSIAYLVLISTLIVGLFSLFRGNRDLWIMSTPQYRVLPFFRLVESFASSLWPVVVLVIPALLAMYRVFGFGMGELGIAFLSIGLLIVFMTTVALSILLLACIFLKAIRQLNFANLILALVIMVCVFLSFGWRQLGGIDVVELFNVTLPGEMKSSIVKVSLQFRVFPSHYPALTLHYLQIRNFPASLTPMIFSLLIVTGSFLIYWFLTKNFLVYWQMLQEGRFVAKLDQSPGYRLISSGLFLRFLTTPLRSVLAKETITTLREMKNILWLGFLIVLWLIQVALNFFLKRNLSLYTVTTSQTLFLFQSLQIIVILYFISAFVLRFAFPSFSVEKDTAWILASSPMDQSKIFWAKFIFYAVFFTGLGVVVGTINALILGYVWAEAAFFLLFTAIAIIFITTLGLSLGALFPNFETDDPEALSTSLPGLGFIFISLLYGGTGAYLFYHFLITRQLLLILIYLILTVVAVILFLITSAQKLKRIEFIKVIE